MPQLLNPHTGGRELTRENLEDLPQKILNEAMRVGFNVEESNTSSVFLHVDQKTVYTKVGEAFEDKIEMMDTKDALDKYPWIREHMWALVNKDKDEYTREVAENWSGGYFMYIKPGAKVTFPLQSCLMITAENSRQRVHNIIIAGTGSESQVLTTCTQHHDTRAGAHLGVSEIWVLKTEQNSVLRWFITGAQRLLCGLVQESD